MATLAVVPVSSSSVTAPTIRVIGLDIHKRYLVACGVDSTSKQVVYGPKRVESATIAAWMQRDLLPTDAVVLEMTTHTWQMVDLLTPHVSSVTVVHPPHVHLITRARVMNDQRMAVTLAQPHAANLLPPVWVPPPEVRDLRALVAQRRKMVKLGAVAKNRLQSLLHRIQITPPADLDLYSEAARTWWLSLPISTLERFRLGSDLDTLSFAKRQIKSLDDCLGALAAEDEHIPLLVQIPGMGGKLGMMVLAAIGDISRFPTYKHLVGYAGLGARVHDSGDNH